MRQVPTDFEYELQKKACSEYLELCELLTGLNFTQGAHTPRTVLPITDGALFIGQPGLSRELLELIQRKWSRCEQIVFTKGLFGDYCRASKTFYLEDTLFQDVERMFEQCPGYQRTLLHGDNSSWYNRNGSDSSIILIDSAKLYVVHSYSINLCPHYSGIKYEISGSISTKILKGFAPNMYNLKET